jgi:hypothetical protein
LDDALLPGDRTDPNRGDEMTIIPTQAEVVRDRLRMLGFGLIVAAVVVESLEAPFARWRGLKQQIAARLDPLGPPGTALVEVVADLLTAADDFVAARARR